MENPDIAATFQSSLPRKQVMIATGGLMLSMFLGSLYQTIVATAMPRIITDLGGFTQYTWVFTSYLITQTIAVPLAGKLSDVYGRKWFFVVGLSIFVVASFLSGISQTILQLIIYRGLQGIGFGIMMALGTIVIADLFPPLERGKYGGLLAGTLGLATIIGPTVGGYLTDYLSWRWCFFITIPLGIIVIILFIFYFPQYKAVTTSGRVDYTGAVLIIFFIMPLMLALTWGGVNYPWNSPLIIGLFVFSAVMLALFLFIESRTADALLPLKLFRNRVVAVSAIVIFLVGLSHISAVTFIPLYFQGVLGATAAESGGFLTPMMFSMAMGSVVVGQAIARTGGYYRFLATVGLLFMGVGLYLLSQMTVDTTYGMAIVNIVLIGFGVGIMMPVHTIAVQNTVPYSIMGATTSMITLLRQMGSLFGLSIVGSILNNRFSSAFMAGLTPEIKSVVSPEKLASIVENPQALVNVEARAELQSVFGALGSNGQALFEQTLSILQNALNSALAQIFMVVFGVAILALLVNFFLKGIPSYQKKTRVGGAKR